MTLDVLLVNPASRARVYQSLGQELAAVEPPVWCGLLGGFARGRGRSVAILDAEAEELPAEAAARRAVELDPRLVVVVVYGHQPSASTQVMPSAGAFARALKALDPARPVLLVGGHVAALPGATLLEEAADWTCAGEGFWTIDDLVEGLRQGDVRPELVRDLWWRDPAGAAHAPALHAPLVTDLDREVPELPWDLLPMQRYRAHNWHCLGGLSRQPYAALYTTLGCPFQCTFCCIQAPFKSGERAMGRTGGNSYRMFSPRRVVDELERLATRWGVRNVKLADEMFVLNRAHVEAICDGIIERGLDLNIWAYARVDTVKEGMVDKLLRAGFRWLAFGIEAADARVRDQADKGFAQETIVRTIERVRRAGIKVIGNYIFGLPEDDRASMQATLDLAIELNCEFANFYCAMAYPGSPLHDYARARGWALPATWSGYSQHSVDTEPLQTLHLSAAEVLAFRDEAFHTCFEGRRYLEMVERDLGPEALAEVKHMTAHRLMRRLLSPAAGPARAGG